MSFRHLPAVGQHCTRRAATAGRPCWGRGGMAALMPTVDAVMRPAFGRPKIMEALELFGVRAAPRQGAKALKEQLLQLIQDQAPGRVVGDGMVVDGAPAHAPAAAAAIAPGAKPSAVTEGLLARLPASGGAFKADDITFSVRTMLDESAHALPGSLAALKSIAKEIGVVRQRLAKGELMPDKLHRTIRACLSARGDELRDAMLAALELDLGVRTTALADKKAATKFITDSSAAGARRPDPVLKAMGVDGRGRALWEYYKACAAKKPVYGTRAYMSHGPGSYIGQLHASLTALLDPRVVQDTKHMHSPKALRDFVVSWCFFWQCCKPPFQTGGERGQWVADQWEELPMHEIENAHGFRPLPQNRNEDGDHKSDGEDPITDAADGGDEDIGFVPRSERQQVLEVVAKERRSNVV